MDTELSEVLSLIPKANPGNGFDRQGKANAFVYIDWEGNLSILPVTGGWLGAKLEDLQGNVAPFNT